MSILLQLPPGTKHNPPVTDEVQGNIWVQPDVGNQAGTQAKVVSLHVLLVTCLACDFILLFN